MARLLRGSSPQEVDAVAERVRKFANRFPRAVGPAGDFESLAEGMWKEGRYSEAVSWATKAVQIRRETGDRRDEAVALWYLGVAQFYAGNLDEALQQLELALSLTPEGSNPRREARIKRTIGRVHEDRGEIAVAREWFASSLSLFDELGDEAEQDTTREAIKRVAAETRD
jgi:tetratricopeptide (TPR) repeat protein